MNRQPHMEYMRLAIVFAVAFAIASIPLALLMGVSAASIWGSAFGWSVIPIVISAGMLIVAVVLILSLRDAQWIVLRGETVRFDRTDAETKAIQRAGGEGGGVVQTNIAGPGATIKAPIRAPRISVRGKQVSWNQVNQIAVQQPEVKRIEIPREDVLWMLEQFVNVKHSKRLFTAQTLPYCQLPAYPDLYNEVIRVLVEGQAILGRSPKTAGRLVVKEVPALMKLVDVAHPKGVVLELAAKTGAESGN